MISMMFSVVASQALNCLLYVCGICEEMEKLEASGVTSLPKHFLLNDQALLPALEDDSIAELRLPVAREKRERPTATIEPTEGTIELKYFVVLIYSYSELPPAYLLHED